MENIFKHKWQVLENHDTRPRCMRELKTLDFFEFKEKVMAPTDSFADDLVSSLYQGDVYILKNAFSKEFMQKLTTTTFQWGQELPSEYHQMLEGCPDYHKIIDVEAAKKFSYDAVRHSHFFFPWNADPLNFFGEINDRWRVFKYLGGFQKDVYENNTPLDGIVDRIQVARYPAGGGGLEAHVDPFVNQKMIIGAMMSKRGLDYLQGGFYCMDQNVEKVDLENYLDVGDMVCAYPTVVHGVDAVDPDKELDWNSIEGRWFLGLYSNDSNHVEKRNTTVPLTNVRKYILGNAITT
jgi:hypothetical protein